MSKPWRERIIEPGIWVLVSNVDGTLTCERQIREVLLAPAEPPPFNVPEHDMGIFYNLNERPPWFHKDVYKGQTHESWIKRPLTDGELRARLSREAAECGGAQNAS